MMLSFDNGFSYNFLPLIHCPELQKLRKPVKNQLTSAEHKEYTQIRLRYLFKNKSGWSESIWIILTPSITDFFPSEATWKYIPSSSHFTWLYKVLLIMWRPKSTSKSIQGSSNHLTWETLQDLPAIQTKCIPAASLFIS